MSTIQERQKKRDANHEARVADSKKSLGQKVGNFFTRRNTASASAPANKRMTTYKVFKDYTPKNKRILSLGNDRNIVWDLAVNEPNDDVVEKAKARYLKLLKGFANLKDKTEFYTLYQLLKDKNLFGNIKQGPTGGTAHNYYNEIQYNAPTPAASPSAAPAAAPSPSAAPAAAPANSGNPTPPASGATSINSNAGDPESIEGTIKKMKCTVCKSQEIISEALGTPARSCNNCGAVAPAAAPSANAAAAAANANAAAANANAAAANANAASSNVNLTKLRKATNTSGRTVYIDKEGKKAYIVKNEKQITGDLVGPDDEGDYYIDMPEEETIWLSEKNRKLTNATPATGGRRSRYSRRRHRKTSRRTKNKRSTRRR